MAKPVWVSDGFYLRSSELPIFRLRTFPSLSPLYAPHYHEKGYSSQPLRTIIRSHLVFIGVGIMILIQGATNLGLRCFVRRIGVIIILLGAKSHLNTLAIHFSGMPYWVELLTATIFSQFWLLSYFPGWLLHSWKFCRPFYTGSTVAIRILLPLWDSFTTLTRQTVEESWLFWSKVDAIDGKSSSYKVFYPHALVPILERHS